MRHQPGGFTPTTGLKGSFGKGQLPAVYSQSGKWGRAHVPLDAVELLLSYRLPGNRLRRLASVPASSLGIRGNTIRANSSGEVWSRDVRASFRSPMPRQSRQPASWKGLHFRAIWSRDRVRASLFTTSDGLTY